MSSVSPLAPLAQLQFLGPLPAVREHSRLSDLPPVKTIIRKKKKKKPRDRRDSMMLALRQELQTLETFPSAPRRRGSLDISALHKNSPDEDFDRTDMFSPLSTTRLRKRHSSFSFSRRRHSSVASDSSGETTVMTDLERKKFNMLQTLDQMGFKYPKKERKVSLNEVTMYENLLLQKKKSLTTRMLDATYLRRYRRSSSLERASQQTPVEMKQRKTPEMTAETREKLKYVTDTMTKSNKEGRTVSESPVSNPFTSRSRISSTSSDQGGEVFNTIRRRFRKKKTKTGNRFKRLAKFLVILLRAWRIHSQNVNQILGNFDTLDAMTKGSGSSDLLFDITEYKASKEAKVSNETKRILQKKPGSRTAKELHYLKIALRNYKSIVEYPVNMQKMLAERSWIESYNAKRVIIREGHIPVCFYFILTGSAVVSVMDAQTNQAKTVMFLNRGDSFGEQAIMTSSVRQTTVISRETVEFLVIRDTDFVDIFMSGGLRDPNDPFIRSIYFLKEWPVEKLADNPKKAMFSFFKRGTVLVHDSSDNEWLFVVKSGSCSVLKKLDHVDPRKTRRKPKEKVWREKIEDALQNDHVISHEDQIALLRSDEIKKLEQKNIYLRYYALPDINIATNAAYQELRSLHQQQQNANEITRALGALQELSVVDDGTESIITEAESKYRGQAQEFRKKSLASLNVLVAKGPFLMKAQGASASTERQRPLSETTYPDAATEVKEKHVTIRSAVTTPEKEPEGTEQEQEQEKPPIFLEVRILTKGMSFGLNDIIFEDQTVFSLVSNGVEVVMLNKKFFMEYMSNNQLVRLREKTYPYPSDEDLKRKLELQLGWNCHRKITVNNTLRDVKIRKSDKNDARALLSLPPVEK